MASILVFAGSLTRSVDVGDEAEQALAEIAELTERVETGRAEIDYLDTEEFVDQVARSVGLGARGEKPFALQADAPSPAPVVPLGSLRDDSADQAAFEAWMDLLFGA